MKKRFRGLFVDAVRFLGIGAVNALLTTALYQLALFWLADKTSLGVAWLAGLTFVSFAYPKLVFRTGRAGPYRVLANAGYYIASFFLSYWLLDQFARLMSERLAVFAMLAVITPLNFFVSRYIFRSGRNSSVFESIAHDGRL